MKKLFKSKTFLGAVLSIALCASLIAGATFAIFTSESKVNIAVTSGKVNVTATVNNLRLYSLDNINANTLTGTEKERTSEGKFLNEGTATLSGNALTLDRLTPGDRVTFNVNIANNSNVTVKYRMRISIADDTGLASELNIKIGDYTGRYATIWEELAPGEGNQILACEIALPAASTVQDKSCTISLLAEAVQGNAAVSNDEHYPATAAGLKEAMQYGGKVFMEKDIDVNEVMVSGTTATIDMNGKTISNTADLWNESTGAWSLVSARGADAKLTVDGNGKFAAKENDCFAVDVQDGATVTIKSGTFIGNVHAVYVYEGTAEIKGGFYSVQQKYNVAGKENGFVLNCYDANRKAGIAEIIVTGGTFVNFNPADCWAEGEHTNFVKDGYSVISEAHGADTWYTVVKGTGAVVGTQEDLTAAITENATATVKLEKEGTYTLPSLSGKDVTVVGTKDTVIDMKEKLNNGATNVSFEGVTVNFGTNDYKGFQHTGKLTYKDCTITGKQFLYGTEVEFINCKFVQDAVDYNVWTYGAGKVLFKDCEFDCVGKAVLIYNEGAVASQTVEFQNCKFNASAPADGKAAIEIDSRFTSYNVIIDQATADNVNGFGTGSVSGNSVWNVKKASKPTTVTVAGTVVYNK